MTANSLRAGGDECGAPLGAAPCPSCSTPVASDDRFCSACGAAIVRRPAEAPTAALLAHANLLRSRGDWDGAEARCIEALRVDTNSHDANSLLGDIYRDRGRFEEASQWYRMALEIEPSSVADRAKLRQMEDALARDAAREAMRMGARTDDSRHFGTQRLAGLPPTTWFRAIWASVAAFVVLVIVLAIGSGRSSPPPTFRGTLREGSAPNRPGQPNPTAPPAPVTMPAEPSPAAQTAAVAPTPPTPGPLSPNPARAPAAAGDPALAAAVARDAGFGQDVLVTQVAIDSQDRQVEIELLAQPPGSGAAAPPRERVVEQCFRAARAGFGAAPAPDHASLVYRVTGPDGQPAAYFAAEMDRPALASVQPDAPATQLLQAFVGVWWADAAVEPGTATSDNTTSTRPQ